VQTLSKQLIETKKQKLRKKGAILLRILILFYFTLLHGTYAYADNIFATGFGKAFDVSPVGQMISGLLKAVGAYASLKAIYLVYEYKNGIQTQCSTRTCASMFIAGVLLFYAHVTINAIYNSV